jgi:NADH-quinone oxidoreductase subunit N
MLTLPLSIEIYLSLAALYCLLVAVAAGKISKLNYSFMPLELTIRTSVLCLILALILALNGFVSLGAYASYFLDQGLVFDTLGFFSTLVVGILTLFALLYYFGYAKSLRTGDFELPILMVYSFASMVILLSSSDFIVSYLAIELQSLVFYILAASNRHSPLSTEAGLKYFVLGAFVSGLMLFGIATIYLSLGTVEFHAVRTLFGNPNLTAIFFLGLAFFISAILFKLSAFPFHSWTPDVYAGSPLPVTAFFSVVPKLAVLTFLVRLYNSVFAVALADWNFLFILLGLGTLTVGTFGALYQSTFKRLLAYSTISHVGFMVLGFSTGLFSGLVGSLTYVLIYSLTNLGIFGLLLSLRSRFTNEGDFYIDNIADLRTLFNTSPVLSFLLALFLLSLSGIPPLAGFFGKYSVLISLVEARLYTVAVLAVLIAFVSAYYYLRLIKLVFFMRPLLWSHRVFSVGFAYALGLLISLNAAFLFIFETTSLVITLWL